MRRALISKDLDRGAASKRAQKGGGDVRSPMRGTPFSQDSDRGDGFEKDTSQKYFFTCVTRTLWKGGGEGDRGEMGGTRAGYKGEKGEKGGGRDTAHDKRPISRSNAKPCARPYAGC